MKYVLNTSPTLAARYMVRQNLYQRPTIPQSDDIVQVHFPSVSVSDLSTSMISTPNSLMMVVPDPRNCTSEADSDSQRSQGPHCHARVVEFLMRNSDYIKHEPEDGTA